MDDQRFDAVTRALAAGTSRRRLLRLFAAGTIAGWRPRSGVAASAPRPDRARTGEANVLAQRDCPAGQTGCRVIGGTENSTYCTDTASDPRNCGGCNNECASGVCAGGVCGIDFVCDPGLTDCNGVCVDLAFDSVNCGGCGNVCASQDCADGVCIALLVPCETGLTDCNGVCVDLATDPNNCGACGVYCDGVCASGTCGGEQPAAACDPGLTACVIEVGILAGQTECFDLSSDYRHCGACNNFCESGQCAGGTCAATAPEPVPAAEGCDAGLTDCGACVDLSSDTANCGACGFICALNAGCTNGECLCPDDWGYCEAAGACYDFAVDANNCGGCGVVCAAGTVCRDAVCRDDDPEPTPEPAPTARPGRTPTTDDTDARIGWPFDPTQGQWTIVNGYRGNRLHAAETADGPNPSRFAFDFARCPDGGIDEARGICTNGGGDDGLFGQGGLEDVLGEDGIEEILGPANETGWDRKATRGATVLSPVTGRVTYTGERTPTCRYVGIDIADHPGYQILLVNVEGAPSAGEVARGEPIGTVATGSCGDGDAGDYLLMLLFRRLTGDEPDPDAEPEGLPFAGDWAIAGCAYPDDRKTANQYRGQLAPCRADDA